MNYFLEFVRYKMESPTLSPQFRISFWNIYVFWVVVIFSNTSPLKLFYSNGAQICGGSPLLPSKKPILNAYSELPRFPLTQPPSRKYITDQIALGEIHSIVWQIPHDDGPFGVSTVRYASGTVLKMRLPSLDRPPGLAYVIGESVARYARTSDVKCIRVLDTPLIPCTAFVSTSSNG